MFARAGLTGLALALLSSQALADKVLTASRAAGAIAVDGALDEPAWAAAAAITDFRQKEPIELAAPSHPTEVRVLFDGDALYVGARLYAAPGGTRRAMTRRDETTGAERFIVSVDPYRSRRIAYSFAVTVAGVRADWIHTDDDEHERDSSWNPVWSAATRVLPDGWSAELRIPWSQLRYPRDGARPWGINFNRFQPDGNEDVFWIVVPKERTGWSSYMGELHGLERPPRRLGLELLPYVSTSLGILEDGGDLDPGGNVGLDAKLGLGAGLSLDLAINPDFGQVEADPAIVNLGAFETTFAERRPFFVAGNEIFGSAPVSYFYSRRVGALPRDTVPADATEAPGSVRILGAAKLSGRFGEQGSIGALAAVTDGADAQTPTGAVAIAPPSAWGVARLERELGASRLGASAATVVRGLDDPRLALLLPGLGAAGGVDGLHRWDDGAWELQGHAGASVLTGDAAAIARVQTSSTHYFQRPDATHKHFDPSRTSIAGWHAGVGAGRRAGTLRAEGAIGAESPGFDLNGAGLLNAGDETNVHLAGGWYDTTPDRWQAWHVGLTADAGWSFAGDRRYASMDASIAATTKSFIELGGSVGAYGPALSDTATRGGPLMRTGGGVYANLFTTAHRATVVTWSIFLDGSHAPVGATDAAIGGSVGLRPNDHLRLDLAPRLHAGTERRQYVATIDDPAASETFGQRFVFAALDLVEVSAQLRAAITLTPDLAIDLYLEPFVSSGRYHDLGELAAPGSSDLVRYTDVRRDGQTVRVGDAGFTLAEPDFTERSLRSTAVLRWEPRAGSTLYAVWQQDRSSGDGRARAVGPGLVDAFAAPGAHVFALKLAWWFAR